MTYALTKEQEKMFTSNLALVKHVIHEKIPVKNNRYYDFDDLVSAGNEGLVKAIKTFEGGKGTFATYACTCIYNSIVDSLRRCKGDSHFDSVVSIEVIGENNTEVKNGAYQEDICAEEFEAGDLCRILYKISEEATSKCVKLGIVGLVRRNINGYSDEEIAAELGLDQKTVRSYICRASVFLRSHPLMGVYKNAF